VGHIFRDATAIEAPERPAAGEGGGHETRIANRCDGRSVFACAAKPVVGDGKLVFTVLASPTYPVAPQPIGGLENSSYRANRTSRTVRLLCLRARKAASGSRDQRRRDFCRRVDLFVRELLGGPAGFQAEDKPAE
jgi:hypothetical protein